MQLSRNLIDELIKRLGEGFKKMLYGRDGKLSKESIILRNGKKYIPQFRRSIQDQ
jgi:hypothetical protein